MGGEFQVVGFFLDGYDAVTNTAYEYDEKRHFDANSKLNQNDEQYKNNLLPNLQVFVVISYVRRNVLRNANLRLILVIF